jgi:uncharacterized protein (DUF885 family)
MSIAASSELRNRMLALGGLSAAAETMTDKAQALFTAYYEWELRERPTFATAVGDHRYDDRLPDVSEGAIARRNGATDGFARQLREIDRGALSGQDRLSYDVLARLLDIRPAGFESVQRARCGSARTSGWP